MKTRIADLRRAAGLSQTELAELIGTKITMLGKLERGERALTTSWIEKLSKALGVDPGWLFDSNDDVVLSGYINGSGEMIDAGSAFLNFGSEDSMHHDERMQTASKRSYMVEWNPLSVSIPREANVIVDLSAGGGLSEELSNVLAMVTLKGREHGILGTVVRPSGANSFMLLPIGGPPIADEIIVRIDPVVSIEFPIPR